MDIVSGSFGILHEINIRKPPAAKIDIKKNKPEAVPGFYLNVTTIR